MRIRDANDLIGPAVADVLQRLPLTGEDAAAAKLAERYAAAIDDADNPTDALHALGPKLLSTLEQLGATPKARAQLTKGRTTTSGRDEDELTKLRAARSR